MAILNYSAPLKGAAKASNANPEYTKGRAIRKTIESFRQRVKFWYPNAVFETEFVLGISIPEYVAYIESLMAPGMTWENKKDKWTIRSIQLASAFDMTTGEGFYAYFNYKNMRPEWRKPKGFVADPDKVSPVDREPNNNADQVEGT